MLAVLQWLRPADNPPQGLPEGTRGEEDKMAGEEGGGDGVWRWRRRDISRYFICIKAQTHS